jgi:hypothetical protein
MDRSRKNGYCVLEARMERKQKIEAAGFLAGWLEKVSVGCLVVGLFRPEHMIGGMIGSMSVLLSPWESK